MSPKQALTNMLVPRGVVRSLCLAVLVTTCSLAPAQTSANRGNLGGMVSDASGAPMPGARVKITSDATALSLETTTNPDGLYEFAALEPGSWSVNVELNGVSVSLRQVNVSVGDAVRVNLTLSLQQNVADINLAAAPVATAEPSPSELLDNNVIHRLPTESRRFQDFAVLAPGVQALPQTRGQLSFSGQRGIYSNVMVDGSDYNEPYLGGIRGGDRSSSAFTLPLSAIQEFQVVESGYSNAWGRSTGGVLNVLTRSGSNTRAGNVFYQARPRRLSRDNPYGIQSLHSQHQFGGAWGGPIQRNRLFVFLAGEGQLASFPQNVRFSALDTFTSAVTSDIAPAYNYLRSLERSFSQTNDIAAGFGRLDYQFRGGSRLAARYNHSQNRADNASGSPGNFQPAINRSLSANANERDFTDTGGIQHTAILPGAVNELRLAYSRERRARTANAASPSVLAGTLGRFGSDPNAPWDFHDYRAQLSDQLSLVRGRHSVSAGVDYSYVAATTHFGANSYGNFVIDNSDPRRILQILSGTSTNRFDDPSVSYLRQVGSRWQAAHANQASLFAQDNWRLTPALALNFGLRWEGQINQNPRVDNNFLLNSVRGFAFPLGGVDPSVIRSQLNQWAPRASFAWSPANSPGTVVRGSAGVFYGQTPLVWYAGALTSFSADPGDLTLQIAPQGANTVYRRFLAGGFNLQTPALGSLPVFSAADVWMKVAGRPDPFAGANVVTTSGDAFRNPRSVQLSLSAQHEFRKNLVIDYQFDNLRASQLERNVDFNTPRPVVRPGDLSLRPFFGLRSGTRRPSPDLGAVLVRASSARSNYLGNTLRARYRSKNVQVSAHYTLSYNKSDDDNERQPNEISYQNPFDLRPDYNWSNFDARHQASGYALWQAPLGFELTSRFLYRSALPVDAITGNDTSELLTPNFGNRPLESPGVYMLRNSFRNRDFKTFDIRVARNFRIKETSSLQLYTDVFNIFNFSNVAFTPAILNPANSAFIYGPGVLPTGTTLPPPASFLNPRTADGGWASGTTMQQGTPLQVQLGARLTF